MLIALDELELEKPKLYEQHVFVPMWMKLGLSACLLFVLNFVSPRSFLAPKVLDSDNCCLLSGKVGWTRWIRVGLSLNMHNNYSICNHACIHVFIIYYIYICIFYIYIWSTHTHIYIYVYTVFISLFIVHAHASGMPEASSLQLGFRLSRFHHGFRLARHLHMCALFVS